MREAGSSKRSENLMSEPMVSPSVIEVNNLAKSFWVNERELRVFEDFSCRIEKESFLSIIGPSGCGKSTLLKIISGLEIPSKGRITFKNRIVDGPPKGMIYVFQQYTKSSSQKKLGKKESQERCQEYIHLVGLDGYENYHPYQLSGGMQQRVCIARALICEPDVLLMDEPFSAVDAMTRAILQELILRIWETLPITILFVTHDVEEAVFLSTRIISLSKAPAVIKDDVVIDLPFPRDPVKTRGDARFTTLRQRLFSSIFMEEKIIHEVVADNNGSSDEGTSS